MGFNACDINIILFASSLVNTRFKLVHGCGTIKYNMKRNTQNGAKQKTRKR